MNDLMIITKIKGNECMHATPSKGGDFGDGVSVELPRHIGVCKV